MVCNPQGDRAPEVEQLLNELAVLRDEVSTLRQSNDDLQIALETTAAHGDCIEEELQSSNVRLQDLLQQYKRQQRQLQMVLEMLSRQKQDLELVLAVTLEHGQALEEELLTANRHLKRQVSQHQHAEAKLQSLMQVLSREKNDLENVLRLIIEHGDAVAEHWYDRAVEADRQAQLDELTQLANRRRFDAYLLVQLQEMARRGTALTLMMVDIDAFKPYNDCCGHVAGDRCLQRVAQAMERSARNPGDLVARYGGEEFAIVLPHTTAAQAVTVAQRVRETIENLDLHHPQSPVGPRVTVSIGIAEVFPQRGDGAEMEALLLAADRALYVAKDRGRNRAEIATQEIEGTGAIAADDS